MCTPIASRCPVKIYQQRPTNWACRYGVGLPLYRPSAKSPPVGSLCAPSGPSEHSARQAGLRRRRSKGWPPSPRRPAGAPSGRGDLTGPFTAPFPLNARRRARPPRTPTGALTLRSSEGQAFSLWLQQKMLRKRRTFVPPTLCIASRCQPPGGPKPLAFGFTSPSAKSSLSQGRGGSQRLKANGLPASRGVGKVPVWEMAQRLLPGVRPLEDTSNAIAAQKI